MKIKINEKLICIPPYVSVTWDRVTFLQAEEEEETKSLTLVMHLSDGKRVKIPHLDASVVDIIFSTHVKYLEQRTSQPVSQKEGASFKTFGDLIQQLVGVFPKQISGMPIRFGISGMPGFDDIETAFQHNASQSETPDIPKEILEKMTSVIKLMTNGDTSAFPKPEPHCNCVHCQVARTIHGMQKNDATEIEEEAVSNEDLNFRTWDITEGGDNLYVVTNPLDPKEQYNVYLGTPVGCTCGQPHCEHLKAVLYS